MKPDFLPDELSLYDDSLDKDLFLALTKNQKDLLTYFEYGIDDDPWARDHAQFIKLTLHWFAKQYYLGKVPESYAGMLAKLVQDHYSSLQPYLIFRPAMFSTIRLQVEDEKFRVNSLLFGASSPFFKGLFSSCFEKMTDDWILPAVKASVFNSIEEYINSGSIKDLWKQERDQVFDLTRQAKQWQLHKLEIECAEILKRYLTRENVLQAALDAHRQFLIPYKNKTIEFFNQQEHGLKFIPGHDSDFEVELLDYKQETLDLFEEMASTATHLAFNGDLSSAPEFGQLVVKTPRLIGIDLSGSKSYTGQFSYLPGHLLELNLSACSWLKPETLQEVSVKFPSLKVLELANNVHLNFQAWGILNRFRQLVSLNLSRCHQITDGDLKLIEKSLPHLNELSLEECRQVTNKGIVELLANCRSIVNLDISRSNLLTDKTLIEIGVQGGQIANLNIMHSKGYTDKGLLQLLRMRTNLSSLNIKGCDFSIQLIAKIREEYPFLILIE